MISFNTKLFISDNSGGKLATCIKILGNYKKKSAKIGDIIKVVINKCIFKGKVKKGEIYNALIIRTSYNYKRKDSSYIKFYDNSIILLNEKFEIFSTRIFGPICKDIVIFNNIKLSSYSENII